MLIKTFYLNSIDEINAVKRYADRMGLIVVIDYDYHGDATKIGVYTRLTDAEKEFYGIK